MSKFGNTKDLQLGDTLWSKIGAPLVGGYNYEKRLHILSGGITLGRHWDECRFQDDSVGKLSSQEAKLILLLL